MAKCDTYNLTLVSCTTGPLITIIYWLLFIGPHTPNDITDNVSGLFDLFKLWCVVSSNMSGGCASLLIIIQM